ncbi:MAG: ribosome maturation factor RimM [Bacteroidales bacterium]|jgi:16S rRNA processing protein RimM|nr:ribosome maturation factor RimM [Bacteroidales bacterium]
MKKDDHYLLGSLLKTKGIKGEIIIKFNNDCSEEISKLESIFIDVDNKLVPFFIENIKLKTLSTSIVKLEGIDEEEKAIEFIGSDFYISVDQSEVLQINKVESIDITGYKVIDQNKNNIGVVLDFIDISKNPLLNVKTDNGEILIPAKDELIIEIDDDLQEIILNIPEGLLDIN